MRSSSAYSADRRLCERHIQPPGLKTSHTQSHIVCTSTLTVRDPELMAKARAEGRLWDVDTGHDLMITEPQAVAELLLRVAS